MSYVYTSQHWSQTEVSAYTQYAQPYSSVPSNILQPNVVRHEPAIPVSSYSTLSGALDFSSVTSSPRNRSHSIHKNRTSATAYPASQYDSPRSQGRTRSNSQTPVSPSRSTRGVHGQYYPEELVPQQQLLRVPRPLPTGPTNHVLVPQPEYREDEPKKWGSDPYFRYQPITFQSANIPELGMRIGKVAHSAYPPAIVGADDAVFAVAGDREIKLWILWPGYSSTPLQKRIKTQGGKLTRELALTLIANLMLEFTYEIYRKKVPVDRGYIDWTIGARTDKKQGIIGGELYITRLIHRGGSNWQPEMWAPRRP